MARPDDAPPDANLPDDRLPDDRMPTSPDTAAAPRAWVVTGALAIGLGAGPLLATLAPLPAWTAVGLALGALLGRAALAGEAAVAARDVSEARSPLRRSFLVPAVVTATLATLLTALAVLHAAWGATALVQLGLDGPVAATDKGVAAWMGSEQGFLGRAGWQGSAGLLAAVLVLSLVAGAGSGRLRTGRLLGALLAAALVVQLAAGVSLWLARSAPYSAPVVWPPAWRGDWRDVLGSFGSGAFAGLLAVGAGTGGLHALRRRSADARERAGWVAWLCPLGASALLAVACWPAADVLGPGTLAAPAPYGRQAAVLLLAPPSILGGSAWVAVWDLGLLLAGLVGAGVAAQPASDALASALGLPARGARASFALLVALVAVTCVLLPGATESVVALVAGLLVLAAGVWAGWLGPQAGGSLGARLAGAVVALAALPVAGAAAFALRSLPVAWRENALHDNGLLALGLCAALLLVWWPALLLLAALRARSVRPPAPASPGPRRTRA